MGGTAAAAAQLGIEPSRGAGPEPKRARMDGPMVLGSFAQVFM